MKQVLSVIALLAGIVGLTMFANGVGFVNFKFWAPRIEAVHREVFENTPSYTQGKIGYLSALQFQYQAATGEQKEAVRRLILTESRTVDSKYLPSDLRAFISSIGGVQ